MPIFRLQPNLTLLEKHGYLFESELHIESIWNQEQRIELETMFRSLVESYGIAEHYETLLYIILVRHDDADLNFQQLHKTYNEHKRVKELAQFLTLYEPRRKYRPEVVKIASKLDNFKFTDPILLEWLGKLVKEAVENGNYIPGELGYALTDFARNKNGEILTKDAALDYRRIATYASRSIRKPTVRERNRVLAVFLLSVYDYLQKETELCADEGVRFSEKQLNFLYSVAILLQWLPEDRPGDVSDNKDYMYALLLNFIKLALFTYIHNPSFIMRGRSVYSP